MKRNDWIRYLIAATLVLLVGGIWAAAGPTQMKVKVTSDDGKELTIDVNGIVETVGIDDLAEGEERTYEVGGHPIVIKRVDDRLTLVHEGLHEEHVKHLLHGDEDFVWVSSGGEGNAMFVGEGDHKAHRVVLMKEGDGEEEFVIDIEQLEEDCDEEDCEHIEIKGVPRGMFLHKVHGEDGPFLMNPGGHFQSGDYVHYRCEETGSMLTVKKDENLLDDYIDPVTGCLMKKVDGPEVRVVTIIREEKEEVED